MKQKSDQKTIIDQVSDRRKDWPAWGILIASVIFTILATLYMKSEVDVAAKREFLFACNEIGGKITERLKAHEQILLGGAALFDASDQVTRKEWRILTQRLNVESNFPGIQGIGFALWIPPDRLARHVEEIRNEGFPNYSVRPEGLRGALLLNHLSRTISGTESPSLRLRHVFRTGAPGGDGAGARPK